ncbi:MAG: P-type conjugative transfer ATPase TrbB [Pseudodesulfovibrio sp.]|uniref:P-type conjugative transfer ATPase TrbB n=1 Tax=Pseudodesulfovibrio sp. TaxID=2035812 RepID=UPI003D100756
MNRLQASLTHNLGPTIMAALDDPDVIEIMVNPDQTLWIEKLGQDMALCGTLPPAQSRLIISLVASALETTITEDRPIVEGELPLDGSRFEGLMPPIVSGPSFTIRKRASRVFTLSDYVASRILPQAASGILAQAIETRRNILIVGGTGSGKTTFVNAIIDGISRLCPTDRLIIIEDTAELQSASENTVFMRSSDGVPIQRLVKVSMRYRPTRILVGEVRDGSALDLLKAWNTGHPGGVATVHAGSAAAGLLRLEQLIAEATPVLMPALIAEAVDMICFIERAPGGRRVSDIVSVKGFDPATHTYDLEHLC